MGTSLSSRECPRCQSVNIWEREAHHELCHYCTDEISRRYFRKVEEKHYSSLFWSWWHDNHFSLTQCVSCKSVGDSIYKFSNTWNEYRNQWEMFEVCYNCRSKVIHWKMYMYKNEQQFTKGVLETQLTPIVGPYIWKIAYSYLFVHANPINT